MQKVDNTPNLQLRSFSRSKRPFNPLMNGNGVDTPKTKYPRSRQTLELLTGRVATSKF